MICDKCHVPLIERFPSPEGKESEEAKTIVLECPKCGHTEDRLVIASFWRKLAA